MLFRVGVEIIAGFSFAGRSHRCSETTRDYRCSRGSRRAFTHRDINTCLYRICILDCALGQGYTIFDLGPIWLLYLCIFLCPSLCHRFAFAPKTQREAILVQIFCSLCKFVSRGKLIWRTLCSLLKRHHLGRQTSGKPTVVQENPIYNVQRPALELVVHGWNNCFLQSCLEVIRLYQLFDSFLNSVFVWFESQHDRDDTVIFEFKVPNTR
ncbi:hypothetical protein BJ742DRAFT_801981 [Cladochytrium replicatum]|nr:hypothetical protein BJ742DRAFT_801981 [Cladochytrium replicatum]